MGITAPMDMNYINEKLVIERYLKGALSTEEREAFEEAFLASPELLDQLEAAERLQEGLKDLGADGVDFHGARRSFPATLFHSPRYAVAATVMLAVSLVASGGLYLQNRGLAEQPTPGSAGAVHIVALETVRGVASDEPFNVFRRGEAGERVVLMVDPGFEPYSHFRATITRLDGFDSNATVLQLDNLQPGYEEMLALSLPATLLAAGDYEVRVDGWRSEWPANQEFEPANRVTFRVR